MNGRLVIIAFVCLFLAATLPVSGVDSSFTSLKTVYDKSLQTIEDDFKADVAAKPGQYVKWLEQAMKNLQTNGDLDGFLTVKKEKERFEAEKKVPPTPPANTPPLVAKFQTDYRKSLADEETDRNRQIIALTESYVAKLEALKKDLTVSGKISDALLTKDEIEKAQKNASYTAAKFALADQEVKAKPPAPEPTPSPAVKTVACPRCGGSGKSSMNPCNSCNGTGHCTSCGGYGKRRGIRGSSVLVGCVTCKTSGKCRECGGSGYAPGSAPCLTCNGTGQIPESDRTKYVPPGPTATLPGFYPRIVTPVPPQPTPPQPTPPQLTPPPPTPPPPVPKSDREKEAEKKELEDYSKTLLALHKSYTEGNIQETSFSAVTQSPKDFKGKVIKSKVFLVDARPRSVRVAATQDDARIGGQQLLPYAVDVGNKAEALRQEIRPKDPVVITYGVVHENNLTLFDIARAP